MGQVLSEVGLIEGIFRVGLCHSGDIMHYGISLWWRAHQLMWGDIAFRSPLQVSVVFWVG